MIIEVGSQRYKEIFGARDFLTQPFQSRLPPHRLLVEALADPSKSITAIDTLLADANPNGVLHSAGLQDIHLGTQVLMHARVAASRIGGQLVLPGNGLSSNLADGLVDVMKNFKIPSRASDADVQAFLIEASFAVGMKALGAIGPVGKIAAAVIGFAREIIQLIKQRRLIKEDDAQRREALAYAKLPPLQEPDTQVDAWYVDQVLRPLMEGPSWTPIFSPRFDSDSWVGIERNGGFAFAPGRDENGVDDFGRARRVFTASGGIGFIPGLDQIASVVQVAHDREILKRWSGGSWPIHPQMVTDVGKFFVNTGRLAAVAWAWATEVDASPDLYKLHLGALHERWKRYCDGGRRYLLDNAKDWRENLGKGRVLSDDRRYLAGSAIGCAIGAWRCLPKDNGYSLLSAGVRGDELRGPGLGRQVLGCVMDPPAMDAYASGQACFTTIYEERIQKVLDEALRRQRYFLRHSLVSAYVRADFDAFRDVKIRDALLGARKILLEHPDRMLVELADVAGDEPGVPTGDGKLWKDQLRARGVKEKHPLMGGAGRLADRPPGTLVPPREPPPKVPIYEGPLPWGELAEPAPTGSLSPWHIAGLTAGGLLLGGGAFALARRARKGR
ncbi:MAG: hypothetical protein IPK80_15150 [Nannocystis sp.]|nr:hypothetical protein [Nannocystis sp.]